MKGSSSVVSRPDVLVVMTGLCQMAEWKVVGVLAFAYDDLPPTFPAPQGQSGALDEMSSIVVAILFVRVGRVYEPRRRHVWCHPVRQIDTLPVPDESQLLRNPLPRA